MTNIYFQKFFFNEIRSYEVLHCWLATQSGENVMSKDFDVEDRKEGKKEILGSSLGSAHK